MCLMNKRVAENILLVCFLYVVGVCSSTYARNIEYLGITISKPSVLSFNEDIIDYSIGNKDYSIQVKGNNLLIVANGAKELPTTLFVRYGKDKKAFVAEISPDDNAPIHQFIEDSTPHASMRSTDSNNREKDLMTLEEEKKTKQQTLFSPQEKLEYFNYGIEKNGVKVIVANIAHYQDNSYFRIFVKNNTSIPLNIGNVSFEYISYQRKYLIFRSKKSKLVTTTLAPEVVEIGPNEGKYFMFAIPTYTSNGGLNIFFGESDKGEREFSIAIPMKVLLQARRK